MMLQPGNTDTQNASRPEDVTAAAAAVVSTQPGAVGATPPRTYCLQCDYILDGLDSRRCPECGREFDPHDAKSFATALRQPWTQRLLWPAAKLVGRAVGGAVAVILAMEGGAWLGASVAGPEAVSLVAGFLAGLLLWRVARYRVADLLATAAVLPLASISYMTSRWGFATAAFFAGMAVSSLYSLGPLLPAIVLAGIGGSRRPAAQGRVSPTCAGAHAPKCGENGKVATVGAGPDALARSGHPRPRRPGRARWAMGFLLLALLTAGIYPAYYYIRDYPQWRAEQPAIAALRRAGGHLQFGNASNPLLRVFPNCTVTRRTSYVALRGASANDKAAAQLAQLLHVTELHLEDGPLTDAGLAHLSRLKELRVLSLRNTDITDAGLVYLEGLRAMEALDLSRTRVTSKAIDALWARLGRAAGAGIPGAARPSPTSSPSIP